MRPSDGKPPMCTATLRRNIFPLICLDDIELCQQNSSRALRKTASPVLLAGMNNGILLLLTWSRAIGNPALGVAGRSPFVPLLVALLGPRLQKTQPTCFAPGYQTRATPAPVRSSAARRKARREEVSGACGPTRGNKLGSSAPALRCHCKAPPLSLLRRSRDWLLHSVLMWCHLWLDLWMCERGILSVQIDYAHSCSDLQYGCHRILGLRPSGPKIESRRESRNVTWPCPFQCDSPRLVGSRMGTQHDDLM